MKINALVMHEKGLLLEDVETSCQEVVILLGLGLSAVFSRTGASPKTFELAEVRPLTTPATLASELLLDSGLPENGIGCVPGNDSHGHTEALAGDGAAPNFVTSLALSNEKAIVRDQDVPQRRVESAPHQLLLSVAMFKRGMIQLEVEPQIINGNIQSVEIDQLGCQLPHVVLEGIESRRFRDKPQIIANGRVHPVAIGNLHDLWRSGGGDSVHASILAQRLTNFGNWYDHVPTPANSGVGLGRLDSYGAQPRPSRRGFFMCAAWQVLWAGCVGGRKPCRFRDSGRPTYMVLPTLLVGGELGLKPSHGVFIMAHAATSANALIPFDFNSHSVRVVLRDGAPWFVAADVCEALEYQNPRKAVADHLDDDERCNQPLQRGGSIILISESGLYALVLRSRKPEARKFAKWVTHEVLPAIRKTGGYGTPSPSPVRLLVTADAAGTHIAPVAAETIVSGPAELANAIGCCGLTNLQLLAVMGVCAKRLRESAKSDLRKTRAEKTRVMKSLSMEIAV